MLTRRFVIAETRNDPKTLARIARELAYENINVQGFLIDNGRLLILADHPWKALEVITDMAVAARTEELLQFDVPNQRGELYRVLDALAQANIRINATFGYAGNDHSGPIFLAVDDLNRAESVLEGVLGRRQITLGH